VDEGAVEDKDHVVEEEHLERSNGSVDLLVHRLARYGFDERLVRRELLFDRGLAMINSSRV
jgi:hypothetical protein